MERIKRHGFEWFYLPHEVNIDNIHVIEREVEDCVKDNKNNIVLDMEKLNHIYSTAIGMFIRLHKNIENSGGRLFIVNISSSVYKIFKSSSLEKVLNLYLTDVEFEISIDDAWKKKTADDKNNVAFFSQIESGIYRIVVSGDLVNSNDVSSITGFYPERGIDTCIVDISNIDLIDTYGANILTGLFKSIRKECKRCLVFGAADDVSKILHIFNEDNLIKLCNTEEEALKIAEEC